ncbi:MAG: TatD family hydrolase [Candidatus Rifleibacteriota bacterium]
MKPVYLIDVHAHLQDEKFADDLDLVIDNALKAGVSKIINAGTCCKTSDETIHIAEKYDVCYSLVGIHPHDASTFNRNSIAALTKMAAHPKVLAIGEIGLDFHYDFSPRNVQENVFIDLWNLAIELGLPVVVHVREAYERFFPIVKGLKQPKNVMLHCFSGDVEIAGKAAELGYHFSIGGTLTFPKAESTREVFKFLPLDRIHLETDCPYLSPQPKRGKRNEPAFLSYTFDFLARMRGLSEKELAEQLTANARNFFGDKLF